MLEIEVIVDCSRVNFPLRPLYVGQGSAVVVRVIGAASAASAKLVMTPVGGGTPLAYASAPGPAESHEIYIAGWAFPSAGPGKYEIELMTGSGDLERTFWAGKGDVNVLPASTVTRPMTARS